MNITVSTTNQSISASVSNGTVQASAVPATVGVAVSGGIGPMGPQGPQGAPGTAETIGGLGDVEIASVATGDVLRWSASKWRNHSENELTDGGNFG